MLGPGGLTGGFRKRGCDLKMTGVGFLGAQRLGCVDEPS